MNARSFLLDIKELMALITMNPHGVHNSSRASREMELLTAKPRPSEMFTTHQLTFNSLCRLKTEEVTGIKTKNRQLLTAGVENNSFQIQNFIPQ